MTFVWILSYLCTFLLGGIFTVGLAYYLIERSDKKADREMKSPTSMSLTEMIEAHTQTPGSSLN